jgi:hypothetical protein
MFTKKNYGQFSVSQLRDALNDHVLKVKFLKINGEERTMICTLSDSIVNFVPQQNMPAAVAETGNVVVWDLDAGDWRSFHADRVYRVSLVPDSRV